MISSLSNVSMFKLSLIASLNCIASLNRICVVCLSFRADIVHDVTMQRRDALKSCCPYQLIGQLSSYLRAKQSITQSAAYTSNSQSNNFVSSKSLNRPCVSLSNILPTTIILPQKHPSSYKGPESNCFLYLRTSRQLDNSHIFIKQSIIHCDDITWVSFANNVHRHERFSKRLPREIFCV